MRAVPCRQGLDVTIVDALGLKSLFFTMKLERAGNLASRRGLAEPYREALARAKVLARRLNEMLR